MKKILLGIALVTSIFAYAEDPVDPPGFGDPSLELPTIGPTGSSGGGGATIDRVGSGGSSNGSGGGNSTVFVTSGVGARSSEGGPTIVDDPSEIPRGQTCHNECKPSGGFLGIGSKAGFDRPSCESCLRQNPDLYSFCRNDEGSEVMITKGDFCFDRCKPSRGLLGLGAEKAAFARKSCIECMQKNPRYRPLLNSSFQNGALGQANCTITEDREYAVCNGTLYKRQDGVDESDRSAPGERGGSTSGSSGAGGGSGRAQGQ